MAEDAVKPVVIMLDFSNGYGWTPGSFGWDMVARAQKLKAAAHKAGVQVIHVNSMRRPTDDLPTPSHLYPGTDAVEVIKELALEGDDILIHKRYLSGFSYNDLDYTLRTMRCTHTIICGSSTDNTVLWTSADAFQHHYKVVIPEDVTMVHRQNEGPEAQAAAIRIIRNVLKGEILSLDEVIAKYLQPR